MLNLKCKNENFNFVNFRKGVRKLWPVVCTRVIKATATPVSGIILPMPKNLSAPRTSLVPTDHAARSVAARSAYAARSAAPRLRAARSAARSRGLTTSHTRLAQMVADTIFDRRELGLCSLSEPSSNKAILYTFNQGGSCNPPWTWKINAWGILILLIWYHDIATGLFFQYIPKKYHNDVMKSRPMFEFFAKKKL